MKKEISITINGEIYEQSVPIRLLLVDFIRDVAGLTGTHVGCTFEGVCGACTIHLDDEAVKSCLMLAVQADGRSITTIEGLEQKGTLHPLQSAFIEHDGFQCGFCTSGQIMSAVAMIAEARAGWPSAASADVRIPFTLTHLSRAEIRERMSGNLCRCACYPNIVDAVAEVVARS